MEYGGVNTKILEIAGIDKKVQKHIAIAYRLLFHGKTSVFDVINQIKEPVPAPLRQLRHSASLAQIRCRLMII